MSKTVSYDSMAAASAAMGISIEVMKRAKKSGCAAFRGSRVHAAELRQFISQNSEALQAVGDDSLKDQKTSLEIRKLKRIEDTADRVLVKKTEVAAAICRILGQIASISESKLVNEWPSAVAGLDPSQARVYGRRLHDAMMGEYQKLSKEFPE